MGMLGNALAGLGSGLASMASKYIDEEMQQQRAQFLAELQRQNAVRMDQYNLSPERQAALQAAEGGMITARGAATNAAQVAATTSNAANKPYQEALDAEALAKGTREARAKAAGIPIITEAQNDADLKTLTNEALNEARRGAKAGDIAAEGDAKSKAERKAAADYAGDPAARAGVQARAKDQHIDAPNADLQRQVLQHQLADLKENAKVPPAVKTAVSALQDESKQITAAITKVQAEGGVWDPTQNKAQMELLTRQRAAIAKMTNLLAPYMPDRGNVPTDKADPLGIMGGGAQDKQALIEADMKKTGTTYAETNIDGKKGSVGKKPRDEMLPDNKWTRALLDELRSGGTGSTPGHEYEPRRQTRY